VKKEAREGRQSQLKVTWKNTEVRLTERMERNMGSDDREGSMGVCVGGGGREERKRQNKHIIMNSCK